MLVYFSFKWSLIVLLVAYFFGRVFGKGNNSRLLNVVDMISLGTGRMLKPDGVQGSLMFLAAHFFAVFAKLLILTLSNYSEWVAVLAFFIFSVIFVWYVQKKLPEYSIQAQKNKELKLVDQERENFKTEVEMTKDYLMQKGRYSDDRFIGSDSDEENPYTNAAIERAIFERKFRKNNYFKKSGERIRFANEVETENLDLDEEDNYSEFLERKRMEEDKDFDQQRDDQLGWIISEGDREFQEQNERDYF
ncbi:hypothetical protein V7147_20780 [Bacillus sp. JJ1521]|uniref:hypothetical protein n=1 Tax=Bacillus sp. JJ1521 TaxID=3122957 RepID=UPI002FFE893E